ncbi:MAG: hypothetical protein WC349_00435 [Patescibacteria group bacterium]|jgi:hypothetical protein
MKIIKPIKLTPKKLSSLTATAIILITLMILICMSLFLYKNFYQTITQSKEIIILREKVAIDTVNIEKFNIIMEKIEKKITPDTPKNITSPFH